MTLQKFAQSTHSISKYKTVLPDRSDVER